jgi:hypothetical protein
VMGNVTYAGAGGIVRGIFDKLVATGALQPRVLPPSGPLTATRDVLAALVNDWSDARLEAIAADNLFLDTPLATRRDEVQRLHESLGACKPAGEVQPENRLRGTFRLECERGWVDTTFTLAPTRPVTVQSLALVEGRPLTPGMRASVAAVNALGSQWVDTDAERLAASALDQRALRRLLTAFGAAYGSCQIGETLSGDGVTTAKVRLTCERGRADVTIRAATDGRIERVSLALPPGDTCVP